MSENPVRQFFDSLAPEWDRDSLESEEQLKGLLALTPLKEGMHVLDVGCGTGIITGLLYEITKEKVLGIDLSPEMIKRAKRKYQDNPQVTFLAEDFLGYEGKKKADSIIIFNAYPHFLDREKLKTALLRNLKQGGSFIILHSLSREDLKKFHHSPSALMVSRELMSPKEEGSFFLPEFTLVQAEEDTHHYLVVLRKN